MKAGEKHPDVALLGLKRSCPHAADIKVPRALNDALTRRLWDGQLDHTIELAAAMTDWFINHAMVLEMASGYWLATSRAAWGDRHR